MILKLIAIARSKNLLLFASFYISLNSLFSINITEPLYIPTKNHILFQTERGIEIRYIILKDQVAKEKNELSIDGIKYPLFKTKESAIESIKYANPKKDYTVVYVLTDKKKNTEIIAIPADNN